MDPRRVLTFRAVAHERSFSAPRATLALTQPAVSQQVAALEKELGARLLDARARRADSSRHAGEVLLEHADAIADRLELARRRSSPRWRRRARRGCGSARSPARSPRSCRAPWQRCARDVPDAEVLVEEGDSRGAGRARAPPASCTWPSPSRTRRCRAASTTALERRDLLREPFLVALLARTTALARPDTVGARRAGRRAVVGAVDRRPDRPRLPRGRLRAAARSRSRATRSRSASSSPGARGHAGAAAARARARRRSRCAPIDGPAPERDVYALLPPGGRHPLVEPTLQALVEVASAARMNGRLLITCPDRHGIVAAVAGLPRRLRREHHHLRPALDRPRGRRVLHADGVHARAGRPRARSGARSRRRSASGSTCAGG